MPCRVKAPLAATGRRVPLIALPAVILLGFVTSCGGNDDSNSNQISPIKADITIAPPTGDPVVWLDKVGASDDLVTIDVKLRTSGPLEFNGFTLYFRFDPTVVQFAGYMQPVNPLDPDGKIVDPFGECGSFDTYCSKYPFMTGTCNDVANGTCMITQSGICSTSSGLCVNTLAANALCATNSDCDRGVCDSGPDIGNACATDAACSAVLCDTGPVIGTRCTSDADCAPATSGPRLCPLASLGPGDLFLALYADLNGQCDSHIVSGGLTDVLLLRVAFNVTSVTPGTRLELISYDQTSMTGDCAILDANLGPLAIPCEDGMATITGTR